MNEIQSSVFVGVLGRRKFRRATDVLLLILDMQAYFPIGYHEFEIMKEGGRWHVGPVSHWSVARPRNRDEIDRDAELGAATGTFMG